MKSLLLDEFDHRGAKVTMACFQDDAVRIQLRGLVGPILTPSSIGTNCGNRMHLRT